MKILSFYDGATGKSALTLARAMLGMSWQARNFGILETIQQPYDSVYGDYDRPCQDSFYGMAKGMIVDGHAPDYVKDTLAYSLETMRLRSDGTIARCKMFGSLFLAASLVLGLILGLMELYAPAAGSGILPALVCASLAVSVICFLCLPCWETARFSVRKERCRQIMCTMLLIQEGASPVAVANAQIPFLSSQELWEFADSPLPKELNPRERRDDFLKSYEDIRRSIQFYTR